MEFYLITHARIGGLICQQIGKLSEVLPLYNEQKALTWK